jgi:hemolysin D
VSILSPTPPARRDDQEFLPAALEILESPPSPVRMAMILFFAWFVVIALVWTYFGRFDIVAIAQGKIQPPGRVKIIQPVESAKVQTIAVKNGTKVKEGDVLVVFDPQDARADVEALKFTKWALEAEIIRSTSALAYAENRNASTQGTPPSWPPEIPEEIRNREERVLNADIAQLESSLVSNEAEIALKQAEKQRLADMVEAQTTLLSNLQDRVTMRSTLAKSGAGSRASLIDGKETMLRETATLTGYRGNYSEADASLKVLSSESKKILQTFIADNTRKIAEAGKTLDEANQRLIKAEIRLANMTLRSPAAGIVQASVIYTIGQVVTPAQDIMRIVPETKTLEVEAYIPNKDIGFIEIGQDVAVKVESFPYMRYGMLAGKVSNIAYDAIPMADAAQIEGNPASASESQTFAGAQRVQNLVFPITITLERPELMVEGRMIPVSPGMSVSAEIKTGSRRIIEYLFSPLFEVSAEAMREK